MQSKRKKPITINIDKINGIESENEIDGYVITDEMKERFNNGFSEALKTLKSIGITNVTQGLSFSVAGIQDGINKATSQLANLDLSRTNSIQSLIQNVGLNIKPFFTPEIQETFRLFGERMREKADNETDRYNNKTHVGMSKIHGFDYLLLTKKEKTDFFHFVIFDFDREDERWQLPLYSFVMSITDREWQDCGMKYYVLQKKKSFDGVEEFEKQLSAPPAPKAVEKGNDIKRENKVLSPRQLDTINRYREYVEFYCRNIKELKSLPIRANRETLKKFNIGQKTLKRAFKEHKGILDTYQIVI